MYLSRLRGRPVLSRSTGEQLGRVSQIVLDLSRCRVTGFRLRHGGLFDRRWRIAALQDHAELNDGAIVLPDAIVLREDERVRGQVLLGDRKPLVVDQHGAPRGKLVDATADWESGRLLTLLVRPLSGPKRTVEMPAGQICSERDQMAVAADDTPSLALSRKTTHL